MSVTDTARPTRTGRYVVATLLAIGALGGIGVKLWLVRPGAKEARDRAAAEHQLVQVGEILQQYWRDHGKFPDSLLVMLTEKNPISHEPYLVPAMVANPWGNRLTCRLADAGTCVLESCGPGLVVRATVTKDEGIVVEGPR